MSQTDAITLIVTVIALLVVLSFAWRRVQFLHREYLLHLTQENPQWRIVEPTRLLPAPHQEPKPPSRVATMIDRAIERAIDAGVRQTPLPTLQKLKRSRVTIDEEGTTIKEDSGTIFLPTTLREEPIEEEEVPPQIIEEEEIEEEPIEEEEIEEETLELEYEDEEEEIDDRTIDEMTMDPPAYYEALKDVLRRIDTYIKKHESIIRDTNKSGGIGLQVVSTDPEDIRQNERVTEKEWKHCLQTDGLLWQMGVLFRDNAGKTNLDPDYSLKLETWYKQYLAEFHEELEEEEEL